MKRYFEIVCLLFMSISFVTRSQDSLSTKHLIPLTYEFTITDGVLDGPGANFLEQETNKAQFTLVGDYPDSKSSSEFTDAIIPVLQEVGYHTMALGVGVPSARILDSLMKEPANLKTSLKALNTQYTFQENKQLIVPIPEMKSVADAQFLQNAAEHDWSVLGFGYESWNALSLLTDEMFNTFAPEQQQKYKATYAASIAFLEGLYEHRKGASLQFCDAVDASEEVQAFLKQAATIPENMYLITAFNTSLLRVRMHIQRRFFEKNQLRIKDEKHFLRQELERNGFDIRTDKLLVKWDRNFLSRGFQPYAFYGIGNTLSELAEYNGSKTLHIAIVPRYQEREGSVMDVLQKPNPLDSFLEMGQRDKWVVIDMRNMMENCYYTPVQFLLNETALDFVKRFDFLVIYPRWKVKLSCLLQTVNSEQ